MGDWTLTIKGIGAHHNRKNPQDADVLAKEVVRILREAGQTVDSASFAVGDGPSEDVLSEG